MATLSLTPLPVRSQRSEILGNIQADHELLFLSIENFRRLFTGFRPPDAAQQFIDIQQLITKKISDHFADEEKRIFPLLLAGRPTAEEEQTIADLCQEHATFLTAAQQLNALLQQVNLAKCKGELWSAIRDFLTALGKHAAKEDRLFESFTNFVEFGDAEHALQVAAPNCDDSYRNVYALKNIATTLAKAGDTKHAHAVFTRALQATNTLSNTIASMFVQPTYSHSDLHYAGAARL